MSQHLQMPGVGICGKGTGPTLELVAGSSGHGEHHFRTVATPKVIFWSLQAVDSRYGRFWPGKNWKCSTTEGEFSPCIFDSTISPNAGGKFPFEEAPFDAHVLLRMYALEPVRAYISLFFVWHMRRIPNCGIVEMIASSIGLSWKIVCGLKGM